MGTDGMTVISKILAYPSYPLVSAGGWQFGWAANCQETAPNIRILPSKSTAKSAAKSVEIPVLPFSDSLRVEFDTIRR